MQGRERADRQLLDAQALVGHLVPAGGMFAFLAAHRQELFADGDFADLFPSGRGRPSGYSRNTLLIEAVQPVLTIPFSLASTTPNSILSRSLAAIVDSSLVIALPGKPSGAGGGDCAIVLAWGEAADRARTALQVAGYHALEVAPAVA